MKNSIVFLFVLTLLTFASFAQVKSLSNPDQLKGLTFAITGNPGSIHYHKPLLLKVKNNSTREVQIKIDNGLMLIAGEESYQNFVVTDEEILAIGPGKTVEKEVTAMCTESSDAAPGEEILYALGQFADPNLLALTQKIEKEAIWGYEAQTAVWALCGNYGLEDIVGYDTTLTRQLTEYVAAVTGQEMPPPPDENDYLRNYYAPVSTYTLTMTGEFSYNLFEERSIIIALVNKENVVVRELFNNPKEKPGDYKRTYTFDATAYTDEYYFVKMIDNGEVVINMKIDTPKRDRG